MKVIFTRHTFHFSNRSGEFNDMYGIYDHDVMVVKIHVVQIVWSKYWVKNGLNTFL